MNSANATQSSIKTKVYIYNSSNSTYRFLSESDRVYLYETDTVAQYILNVTVPQTGILATERIYIEFYGTKYTTNDRKITLYFDSYRPSHVHTTIPPIIGDGVVKVVNGVFQTPATGIFNADVDANANIAQSKIANLTSDLANLYPKNNPSGYITGVDLSKYLTYNSFFMGFKTPFFDAPVYNYTSGNLSSVSLFSGGVGGSLTASVNLSYSGANLTGKLLLNSGGVIINTVRYAYSGNNLISKTLT